MTQKSPLDDISEGLFLFYDFPMRQKIIDNYISRLMACGFPPDRAYRTAYDFQKEFTLKDLGIFVESLEKDVFGRRRPSCG